MTSNIPRQRDLRGIISRQNFYVRAFLLIAERTEGKHALERPGAGAMHIASSSADLGIIVACEVFHQEVDQSRLTLEGGQQRERVTACGRLCYYVSTQPIGQWHFRRGEG
jgi:hypothetical protein